MRRARAVLERELLELAQQALLAVADLGDQRACAPACRARARAPRARLDQPARQLPRLDVALGGDLAAGRLDRLARAPAGALARPSSRAKNATVSVSRSMPAMRGGDRLDVGLLPALDAVGDHEAPAHARTSSRDSAPRPRPACTASPSKTSTPAGAARRLGHRAQARAALGDAAVVVAVDQVGGLEASARRPSLLAGAVVTARVRRTLSSAASCPRRLERAARTVPSRSVRTTVGTAAQRGERGRRGMAVGVVAPDLDRRDLRVQAREQRGQARVGAAVVGDLQRVDRRRARAAA